MNFLMSFRDHFVIDLTWQEPDTTLNLAMNLCKGIGYIILGNLYDNVPKPKKLTFIILVYLALSVICYFFFYPHPAHIGIIVQERKEDQLASGFFLDVVATNHFGLT